MSSFVTDNLSLIGIALVSGGMAVWPLLRARAGGPTLGTLAATKLINERDVQIIDVRGPDEFREGSLENARNMPVGDIASQAGQLPQDKPALVVCKSGGRASMGAVKLRSAGIKEVFILSGGLDAWREAGLPVVKVKGRA
jgi:rhodanese-related sulfurtransferase